MTDIHTHETRLYSRLIACTNNTHLVASFSYTLPGAPPLHIHKSSWLLESMVKMTDSHTHLCTDTLMPMLDCFHNHTYTSGSASLIYFLGESPLRLRIHYIRVRWVFLVKTVVLQTVCETFGRGRQFFNLNSFSKNIYFLKLNVSLYVEYFLNMQTC